MPPLERLRLWVPGKPVQQGSKTVYMVKGKPVLADANSKELKPWRKLVADLARGAFTGPLIVGAVAIEVEFRMVRGVTVRRERPSVKPDVDKLERSILDALTGVVWKDDAQVVTLLGRKVYAEEAGVQLRVGEYREGEKG